MLRSQKSRVLFHFEILNVTKSPFLGWAKTLGYRFFLKGSLAQCCKARNQKSSSGWKCMNFNHVLKCISSYFTFCLSPLLHHQHFWFIMDHRLLLEVYFRDHDDSVGDDYGDDETLCRRDQTGLHQNMHSVIVIVHGVHPLSTAYHCKPVCCIIYANI